MNMPDRTLWRRDYTGSWFKECPMCDKELEVCEENFYSIGDDEWAPYCKPCHNDLSNSR